MDYCDYIADVTFHALVDSINATDALVLNVDNVRLDLHPTQGWLQSTNKTIMVEDRNGRKYKVTVEAVND